MHADLVNAHLASRGGRTSKSTARPTPEDVVKGLGGVDPTPKDVVKGLGGVTPHPQGCCEGLGGGVELVNLRAKFEPSRTVVAARQVGEKTLS